MRFEVYTHFGRVLSRHEVTWRANKKSTFRNFCP